MIPPPIIHMAATPPCFIRDNAIAQKVNLRGQTASHDIELTTKVCLTFCVMAL
jgi:hypothetical protein